MFFLRIISSLSGVVVSALVPYFINLTLCAFQNTFLCLSWKSNDDDDDDDEEVIQ